MYHNSVPETLNVAALQIGSDKLNEPTQLEITSRSLLVRRLGHALLWRGFLPPSLVIVPGVSDAGDDEGRT
jgi:hypothetical protein